MITTRSSNLVETQYTLEKLMLEGAYTRQAKDTIQHLEHVEGANSKIGSTYVKKVLQEKDHDGYVSFLTAVSNTLTPERKGPGRQNKAVTQLKDTGLSSDVVSVLTVKAVFNSIMVTDRGSVVHSTLAYRIGEIVHDQWRVELFSNTDERKNLIKKLLKDFDKKSYPRHRRKVTIRNYFDAEKVSWQGWSKAEKVAIGNVLLSLFINSTGLVYVANNYVHPADALVEHATKLAGHQVYLFVLALPMVVPPTPWSKSNLMRGPYLWEKTKNYPLVKWSRKKDMPRLLAQDWSQVIPAINALQETPWRVNKQMLEATAWTYHEYTARKGCEPTGVGKLPRCVPQDLGEKPDDYYTNEDVKKVINLLAFQTHDFNRRSKSRRIAAVSVLNLATQFSAYEAIYFPHNLDSRGRAYPIPSILNPQGPDYVKALLEFSVGHPIATRDAEDWLCIAGANAYGNDKIPLAERVQWTHDNEEMFLSIANDYKNDLRWVRAGEPFQFLRFCFEWAAYKANGASHVSHMVIPVDATCSGLQHYAAMLRDEVGGKAVNLIPGNARQDIYGAVADVVIEQLMMDGTSTEHISYKVKHQDGTEIEHFIPVSTVARDWVKFGIDRKLTKRQVMVVPYAGKFASCMDYTKAAVKDRLDSGEALPWAADDPSQHSRIIYLAKAIWLAIDQVVVKGKEAMYWLSALASSYSKAMNKTNLPIHERAMTWKTPDGFEVIHVREEEKQRQINTVFDGRIQLVYYDGTGKLDTRDMALAIAPNYVHALDACHLRMTVLKALSQGITHFAMVHDSFGVHAGLMRDFLNRCVKPAFVEMYQQDVIGNLYDRFSQVCPVDPPPEKGSLDLNGVLRSEFFFS